MSRGAGGGGARGGGGGAGRGHDASPDNGRPSHGARSPAVVTRANGFAPARDAGVSNEIVSHRNFSLPNLASVFGVWTWRCLLVGVYRAPHGRTQASGRLVDLCPVPLTEWMTLALILHRMHD